MRLKGKIAVVTGGSSGIGQAICELFAEEGAKVVIADIDEAGAQVTREHIAAKNGEAMFVKTDISREAEVESLMKSAVDAYGTVNVHVNNAAVFVMGKIEDVSEADWHQALNVNVLGPAFCTKHVVPIMKKAGGGVIVNIASISSIIAQPGYVPYNTTKGALLQLTRCCALDLAPDNIRVNCICPGDVMTPAQEREVVEFNLDREEFFRKIAESNLMNRLADSREIAYGALFLACNESSFMTGSPLIMDAGYTTQ